MKNLSLKLIVKFQNNLKVILVLYIFSSVKCQSTEEALSSLGELQSSLPIILPNYPSLQRILKILVEAASAAFYPSGKKHFALSKFKILFIFLKDTTTTTVGTLDHID